MALISARTILTSISLFHLTLAFFFLTNPGTIADQAIVFVIGEAMGLVRFPPVLFLPGSRSIWVHGSGPWLRDATVASGLAAVMAPRWGGIVRM